VYLVLAPRVLIAQDRPDPASPLLQRLQAHALAQDQAGSSVEILALRALALATRGERGEAVSTLVEALSRQGRIGVFADRESRCTRCSPASRRPSWTDRAPIAVPQPAATRPPAARPGRAPIPGGVRALVVHRAIDNRPGDTNPDERNTAWTSPPIARCFPECQEWTVAPFLLVVVSAHGRRGLLLVEHDVRPSPDNDVRVGQANDQHVSTELQRYLLVITVVAVSSFSLRLPSADLGAPDHRTRRNPVPSRLPIRAPRNRLSRVAVATALALAALVGLGFVFAGYAAAPRQAPTAPLDPANVAPAATPANTATPPGNWDKIAACESGSDWNANSGNGYYGGLQFNAATWHNYGGQGLPHQASRTEQIAVGEKVLAKQGWGAWPACSHKTGLR
jgi:hypothetical protein